MAADQVNLRDVVIMNSPPADEWPITVAITRIRCTPAGGFELTFDRPIPDSWKWPSNPAVPSDNFQYTVWIVVKPGTAFAIGAGFVQMWQGRTMGLPGHALPPIFATPPGDLVPGWRNWWGDPRRPWGVMGDYSPVAGDRIGMFITAGNGRLTAGVSPATGLSVRERSNVVLVTLRADDQIDETFNGTGPVDPPVDPPIIPPAPGDWLMLERQIAALRIDVSQLMGVVENQNALIVQLAGKKAPTYAGSVRVPFVGSVAITLTPQP